MSLDATRTKPINPRRSTSVERTDASHLILFKVDREAGPYIADKLSKLHSIDFIDDTAELMTVLQSRVKSIDAVLLGANVDEPLGVAQQISSFDKQLPIVISSNEDQRAKLRAGLMYSPFLGHEVLIWPTTDAEGLAALLADAAERRQQRQRYQEATLANAHVQLEVLPLLQPEAAEYVGGLLDHEPVGVLTTSPQGQIVSLNRQARQILGVTEQEEVPGTLLVALFPETDRNRLSNLLSAAIHSNSRLSPEVFEFPGADAKSSFVEVTATAFLDRTEKRVVMLILQEVTLRIQAEKQRTEAIVELRLIARVLHAFHAISTGSNESLSEKILRILHLGCEQFGLPIGILTRIEGGSLRVLESVSEDRTFAPGSEHVLDRTYCALTVNSLEPFALEKASATQWRDHPTYKEHGLEAYLGVRISVDGAIFGTLCFMGRTPRDSPFTAAERETLKLMSQWIAGQLQRERAEAHMRKLSSAIEQIGDSVVITNPSGIVEYVNPSFEALTGYTRAEIAGRLTNFLPNDDKLQAELWSAVGQGKDFSFLLTDHTTDGGLYHEQITFSPLKDNTGAITHLIATGRDVTTIVEARETDRKRQAELAHVARLSTLGGMISGLSHELNQPLCAIMTYAQTCLRKIEPGVPKLEALSHGLNQIVSQAERANDIFERIRNFSQKRDLRRQRANICEIVESALSFIQTEMHHNQVKLDLRVPKKARFVYVDTVQIQQVLLNLMRNSMDALSGVAERKRTISIKVSAHGRHHTKIVVSDTGIGCPPQELSRLFEPFFTTKESGLGVGLSISQSIVEAHGGKLWLESTSNKGASFCMTLPNWRA
jgi:PAS domain S-box-containing protein